MLVNATKSGGIYIEISGDVSKLEAALKDAERLGKMSGRSISESLSGAINPQKAADAVRDIGRHLHTAGRAAKAMNADLSGYEQHFRNIGKSIGVAEKDLSAFVDLQKRALQGQVQKGFFDSLRGIQRLTGMSNEEMNRLAKSLGGVGNEFARAGRSAADFGSCLEGVIRKYGGIAVVVQTLKTAAVSVGQATLQADRLNKAYTTIYDSAGAASQQLGYLYGISDELGLRFQSTAESAKTFFAAGKGTSLEGDLNRIFKSVSSAGTALSLSESEMQGVFLALGQMISKGKVQAEELRGQLGERLPGAFRLAAQAMGVTTAELDKLLAEGKVVAEDLLPKLATELDKTFGGQAVAAGQGLQGQLNRLGTEWERFKSLLVNSESLAGAVGVAAGGMKVLADNGRSIGITMKEAAISVGAAALALKVFKVASLEAGGVATAQAAIMVRAMAGMRAAGASVLSFFGGPWGIGIAAAAAAVGYLVSAESDAERTARRYKVSLKDVGMEYKALSESADEAIQKTLELSRAQEKAARQKVEAATSLRDRLWSDILKRSSIADINAPAETQGIVEMEVSFKTDAAQKAYQTYKEVFAELKNNPLSLENVEVAHKSLSDLTKSLDDIARADTSFWQENAKEANALAEAIRLPLALLKELASAINNIGTAQMEITFAVPDSQIGLKEHAAKLAAAREAVNKGYEKTDQGRKEALQKRVEDARNNLKLLERDTRNHAKALAVLTQAEKDLAAHDAKGKGGRGAGGAAHIDGAVEKLRKFREEIAQLNGEASRESGKLADKLHDIEKAGTAAKMSATDIAAFKEEYRNAFAADVFRQFDKEMLRLTGNTAALRDMEISEKLSDWQHQFAALGLTAAEAAPKLDSMREALAQEARVKDLQVAAGFYREFASLSADTGQSLEIQNRLIEEQARLWAAAGIPLKDIDLMLKLQKEKIARDPWSGTLRGLRRYANEATDLGKGMEDVWVNGFSAMEDAMTQFVLKGKMDFNSLANSIINDLTRIAVRSTITGPLASGLESVLGGLVGGLAGGLAGSSGGGWDRALGQHVSVVPRHHDGGVVNGFASSYCAVPLSLFADAPRYHRGGPILAPGEVPIIAQAGEHVLTREEGAAYRAGRNAGGEAVIINIHNHSGQDVTQQTRTDNYGNKTIDVMIGDAAAAQAQKPGSNLNRVMRSVSGAQQQVVRR